jgi:hypothetical protein
MLDPLYNTYVFNTMSGRSKYKTSCLLEINSVLFNCYNSCRCTAEENTVHREGAKLSFFKGDGVVKNVPEDKAAVFEVCRIFRMTLD